MHRLLIVSQDVSMSFCLFGLKEGRTGRYCHSTLQWNAKRKKKTKKNAVAGDRTRVTRVTGGNTHHYTTTTWLTQEQD
jgi:hypothetical protein